MFEINCVVIQFHHAVALGQAEFGEIVLECDDWRIADNGGLMVGDRLSVLNAHKYPAHENEQGVFYIGDDTSVWINDVHLQIRLGGS